MHNNFRYRQFQIGVASQATGVSAKTITNWLDRGLIVGGENIIGVGGPGHRRLFSFGNIIEIGIGGAIIDAGAGSAADALKAANLFAHVGWDAGEVNPERAVGLPFAERDGTTYIVVAGGDSAILPANPHLDVAEASRRLGNANGFITVNASAVFERVTASLQYITGDNAFHPLAIYEAAYSGNRG